jgi:hypothetical protein
MADNRPRDRWQRLQAVQLIAMLPEDIEEARRILAYAGRLLDEFIAGPTPPEDEDDEATAEPEAPSKPALRIVRPD